MALEALYQADLTGRGPSEVLAEWEAAGRVIPRFGRELVEGVQARRSELDPMLEARARGWTLERMAVVDRNVLRLALFELLYRADVPPAVAISEAVQAAKALSTEDSGRFVNGILGGVARDGIGAARGPDPAPAREG